jgi:oligopeptide/dipeptide ABC transporter ATP-binding protein
MTAGPVLEVQGLTKLYRYAGGGWFGRRRAGVFRAVSDVSFSVARGETLGIVGESGSGKSTVARMMLRLVEPTAGRVLLNGEELTGVPADQLWRRRRKIQMVFQDPFASLNPRLSIAYHLREPLIVHGLSSGSEAQARVLEMLERVGLTERHARSYPHALSGGQRQRIAIARALAVEPDVLVADEPVSSLDVSVQAQILNLLRDIRRSTQLSMVFISHDLGVVRHVADRVAVMYRGRIVELGPASAVFDTPRHPYTRALLDAIPIPRPGARSRRASPATATPAGATPAAEGGGCAFAPRCAIAGAQCLEETPALADVGHGHRSACFRADAVTPPVVVRPEETEATRRLRRLQSRFVTSIADAA